MMNVAEVQTITLTSATGGTFTLTATAPQRRRSPITRRQRLSRPPSARWRRLRHGGRYWLCWWPYTVTYAVTAGNVAALTYTDSTTGSGHAIAIATTTPAAGRTMGRLVLPQPMAADLSRGLCCILDESLTQLGPLDSAKPPLIIRRVRRRGRTACDPEDRRR